MRPLPLSKDAATVAGIVGTALPFAQTRDEEVERWLRLLRLHGHAAAVLQGLAIGEARLARDVAVHDDDPERPPPEETMRTVIGSAAAFAANRGCRAIGTLDLLVAVMRHYRDAFERALTCRGSDTSELTERLATQFKHALS